MAQWKPEFLDDGPEVTQADLDNFLEKGELAKEGVKLVYEIATYGFHDIKQAVELLKESKRVAEESFRVSKNVLSKSDMVEFGHIRFEMQELEDKRTCASEITEGRMSYRELVKRLLMNHEFDPQWLPENLKRERGYIRFDGHTEELVTDKETVEHCDRLFSDVWRGGILMPAAEEEKDIMDVVRDFCR